MHVSENKPVIGITQGDINGVGIEVILKSLSDQAILELVTPVIFSSAKTISYYRKALGIEEFSYHQCRDLEAINHKKINLFSCYDEEVTIEPGKNTPASGKYAYLALEKAVDALKAGQINGLVTAPISKIGIQSDEFTFPGHTEYLGAKLGGKPLMLLCHEKGLRVAVATGHVSIQQVPTMITKELIVEKITALHESLIADFGIRKPRIAVLGLNPHAGEDGMLGAEEKTVIQPAIEACKGLNAIIYGPYSADGFFGNSTWQQFDGVLAMYHDQGLIPFKTLAFEEGVNYTAGLPFVRTSPDHGTAYAIAGKNQASEVSFRKALYMAIDIVKQRQLHAQITQNPLPKVNLRRER